MDTGVSKNNVPLLNIAELWKFRNHIFRSVVIDKFSEFSTGKR